MTTISAGEVIGDRYRLERQLGDPSSQGTLWLARDQLAADAPAVLRCIGPDQDQDRARRIWARLQAVLHPQVPRFGAVIPAGEQLWLVREWQQGRTYRELLEARRERQLVFGCGEVLLLLRQLLPVLSVLHGQDLLHGDLSPDNLLRRDSDGLPVLLDFGLVREAGSDGTDESAAATPGYAPPELVRGAAPQPWMDLHSLGVVALVLLSGDDPADLLDPVSLEWRWPAALAEEPALAAPLQRLVAADPSRRFLSASQALTALQALAMPESTGPVPRADRTVMLVPPPVVSPPAESPVPEAPPEVQAAPPQPEPEAESEPEPDPGAEAAAVPRSRRRHEEREEAAEGGLWPVVFALVLSAVAGTALGWWWLSRDREPAPDPEIATELPGTLPPDEVDQRQLLLNRLRALQIDRPWFLRLVDASLLAQYPERKGRLPSDSSEDAPLRRVWNDLAEELLARVEQLPLPLRRRLGSFRSSDWERRLESLVRQGLSPSVLRQLVTGSARNLLPGLTGEGIPEEPFRQLWYAAAEQTLQNMRIEPIDVPSGTTRVLDGVVEARGARLFPIRVPPGHSLVLGANGTPLLQMSVFDADGRALESRGPLRVVTLGAQERSPVQLLFTNDGVAPAEVRLQLRADPPPAPQAPPPPPEADLPPEEEPLEGPGAPPPVPPVPRPEAPAVTSPPQGRPLPEVVRPRRAPRTAPPPPAEAETP